LLVAIIMDPLEAAYKANYKRTKNWAEEIPAISHRVKEDNARIQFENQWNCDDDKDSSSDNSPYADTAGTETRRCAGNVGARLMGSRAK